MTLFHFEIAEFLEKPIHTSLFLMDFLLLMFVKFPPAATLVLLAGLVYLSMCFGKNLTVSRT